MDKLKKHQNIKIKVPNHKSSFNKIQINDHFDLFFNNKTLLKLFKINNKIK